ncbi:proton-conducting transporter membrane subunit [Desulfuromonas acetoxidans]|uniref:proton-conducting transporter transmembrane domain-containing protein n=1 Tax=Desulfuromonas acetoxidans TaxID=891 RepID=UPI00292FA94D|nr:proton-conducting transporter membrane subunit [Desulfuromonas acetoxidans]
MTDLLLPPGVLLLCVVPALALLPQILCRWILALSPPLVLLYLWMLPENAALSVHLAGFDLHLVHLSAMGRLFASAFLLATWAGSLFAFPAQRREWCAAYLYAGSAVAISHCGDWISLFLFWEVMAVASTVLVWTGGFKQSAASGMRYLLVHLTGGVLLMSGIAAHLLAQDSTLITPLTDGTVGSVLILAGFLVNAGAPPLSFWVADAYPQSSPSAMVFLSALTTKTAVFVLASCFAGWSILIPIGGYMAIYGIVYALRENDVRRILAYSIVNQVGFMVVAIGIGGETAINGVTLHALAHIFYKTVLVIAAGVILRETGARHATQLGGLARRYPLVTACTLIGAAASMGVPLTSSFISKGVILQAAVEHHVLWIWVLLLACSAAVAFNAGIRFPWLVFFRTQQKPLPEKPLQLCPSSLSAILLPTLLCLAIGMFPQKLFALLPFSAVYHPYTALHMAEQFQILVPAIALFWWLRPWMVPRPLTQLDLDWILRRLLFFAWEEGVLRLLYLSVNVRDVLLTSSVRGFKFLFRHYGPRGILARSWPTGSIALWVALILASYVVLYSLQSRSLWQFIHSSFS